MSCIVTDSRYRMSLAVIRSLGRRGVRVIAQESQGVAPRDVLGFHSRYTWKKAATASPLDEPLRFVDDLLKIGEEGDVLLPVSLAGIFAVLARIDDVSRRFRLALPPLEAVMAANDTAQTLEAAEKVGIRVPRTTQVGAGEDPGDTIGRVGLPAVVKYREGESLRLPPAERYAIVRDEESFLSAYKKMAALQASPLIQEYISGDGWGLSAVMDAAKGPLAFFSHRRLREYPVSGGPSSFCESVYDEELASFGVRLLEELKWHGVAMVEFKKDFATGQYVLMEVNPRFWGSLPLAIASGVDFPYILYRLAKGEEPAPNRGYKTGVKMRYLFQDLLSAAGYLKGTTNRWGFIKAFAGDLLNPRVVDGVFQTNDPTPGFYYAARAFRKAGLGP